MRLATALLIAGLSASAALAQQLGERIPGQRPQAGMPGGAAPERAAAPCPQYGPGFVRLNGSTTCVRLSGQVRFEYGYGGGRSRDGGGTRSGLGVELDARAETDLRQLRAVMRGQATSDTGVMRGRRW